MGKKGDFNFTLLFAIIAGSAILILAIYGAVKFGGVFNYQTSTETAKQMTILTDPLQAGFAEGSLGKIIFQQDTRIENECFSEEFGKNDISISVKSRGKWQEQGAPISVYNKYIFSKLEEGRDYFVFSKPFKLPYKVSDLIFLSSQEYCFINPPIEIEDEIKGLNFEKIKINNENCSYNAINVCFGSDSCDINVYGECSMGCESDYDYGVVQKNGKNLVYSGALMYGAIFSDEEAYNCNVDRLIYRASQIAKILAQKSELLSARGCNSNLRADLLLFSSLLNSKDNLILKYQNAVDIDRKSSEEICRLW